MLPPKQRWFRLSCLGLSCCRYPRGVCTSHYSRTSSNTMPP